jgi:uncharacterized membrane protein
MKRLLGFFLQGLVITVPTAVTVYLCYQGFVRIDSWLGLTVPGAGFAITISAVTLIGFLGSGLITKTALDWIDGLVGRLPFVRILYTSTKDLLSAFVGEKRRFDKPVLVSLTPDGAIRLFGFITQESLHNLGIDDAVAVYFPQSYAFAGHTVVVPISRIQRVNAESSDVLAFVVSGGVTDVPALGARGN